MSGWVESQLSDLCNIISVKTSMVNASLENYVSTENMIPNFGGLVKAEKLPSGSMVNAFLQDDVLFSNIRTYFKKVWFAEFSGTVSADVLVFRAKQTCDPKYLYYRLCEPDFTEYTVLTSRGAKMPRGDKEAILSYKLSLPSLPEQKAIASVLSSLDDKIDLLHRQNKTLEAMAETLFRQWFIEEAKEDWEEVPLSEIAVIQNGYAFSSKDYVEKTADEYEVLKMGHIDKNATLKLNPKRDYVPRIPELKKFVLNYNDIVMPMTDMKDNVVILGVPALVDASDKYVLNQRVARIYLKEDSKLVSVYYLFLQLKDPDFIARLQSTANSGVQVNLSTQAIKDCPIAIPSLEKQAEHKNDIANFYDQISNNRKQIQTLEKLRDTLLPKLMSGEVRVQYQTEEVA